MSFKRYLQILLPVVLLVSVCLLVMSSCGIGETQGLEYELNEDGESYTVVGEGDADFKEAFNLVIPARYQGKPVTKIGKLAFAWKPLGSVVIPDTVIEIGDKAFCYCDNGGISSVTLGKNVEIIGEKAFAGNAITSITIPASVKSISYGNRDTASFSGCSLESITVEEGNTVYDSRNGCNAIIETATNKLVVASGSTTFPSDVTAIGDYAFDSCSGLITSIEIPSSITEIGEGAFFGCYRLASVKLNEGLISIGERAFFGLDELAEIVIPNSVTTIGDAAFQDCPKLVKVVVGTGVTHVDGIAFANGVNSSYLYYRGTEAQFKSIKSGFKYFIETTYEYTGD